VQEKGLGTLDRAQAIPAWEVDSRQHAESGAYGAESWGSWRP